MDTGEPIVDFQTGNMSGPNRAVDHCTIVVVEESTFEVLTFRNNYNPALKDKSSSTGAAIGESAPSDASGVTYPATMEIKGVKTYQINSGSIIAYHYKN